MNRVVVTGIGPLSSLGRGNSETWQSIINSQLNLVKEKYSIDGKEWGEFPIHKIRHFDINDYNIPENTFRFIREIRTVKKEDLDLYYFLAVISLAIKDSELKYDIGSNDIGLILTHENPGIEIFFEELIDSAFEIFNRFKDKKISKLDLARELYSNDIEKRGYNLQTFSYLFSVAKAFGFHGYSLFINNACASGLFAIEAAAQQIKSGIAPVMVVAAVDNPTKIYKYLWFKKKQLYADSGIVRPFSQKSDGIVFGDGGAALVLENLDHARKRKAKIYAEYLGGGFALEGWKITVPNPTDSFYEQSFRKALKNSGMKPADIDFVNPHGVGMKITDTYEASAINRIFNVRKPLVSAFKPLIGHNLGGSALLETAIAVMSLQKKMIPATLNCDHENKELHLNIVKENRKIKMNSVAKMACGFAGFTGVSIFKKI